MARKRPPSLDFYPGDFLAGTMAMEADEVGAYIRLLCYQWEHDTIPNDRRAIALITGTLPSEFDRVWSKVRDKFSTTNGLDDGDLFNERLEAERQKKQEISEKRAAAAHAMHKQSKQGCKKHAKGSRKKEVGRRKKGSSEEGSRKTRYTPDFEAFWSAFPRGRRKSKAAAWKAWATAIETVSTDVLIERAKDYAASDEGHGQYVKMPSTWLNQRCWEDDDYAWQDHTGERAKNQGVLDRMMREYADEPTE